MRGNGEASSGGPEIVLSTSQGALGKPLDEDAQAKALRLRMYVLCPECARLIDVAEGNLPRRHVEGPDLIRHAAEEHALWLEAVDLEE